MVIFPERCCVFASMRCETYDRLRKGIYLDGVVLDESGDEMPPPGIGLEVIRPALVLTWHGMGGVHWHSAWSERLLAQSMSKRDRSDPAWFSLVLRVSQMKRGYYPSALRWTTSGEYADRRSNDAEMECQCSNDAAILGSYFGP